MPQIQCCDCGKRRIYRTPSAVPKRCEACAYAHGLLRKAALREALKRRKICVACGRSKISVHSLIYCNRCAGYHAGYQAFAMRVKRAAAPEYREDERNKVRERMRRIRAERRKNGMNNSGKPLKSPKAQAAALRIQLHRNFDSSHVK